MKSKSTINDIALLLAFFLLVPFFTQAQISEQKITPTNLSSNAQFGGAMAISGEQVIVGAIWDNSDRGAAVVFERDNEGSWNQIQKLTASDGNSDDAFGISIAADGNFMVIGAQLKEPGFASGAAYVFQKQEDGKWTEVDKLTASDADSEIFFGESVSIDDNRIAIGASGQSSGGGRVGAVYIFERQENGSWEEINKINAPGGVLYGFGYSASLSGDRLVIGAIGDQTKGDNSGAAFIFDRQEDGSWTETKKIFASDAADFDGFGHVTALSGNRALIGGFATGSAYIFERQENGSWEEVKKLNSNSQFKSMFFGRRVALHGDRALVSDPGDAPINSSLTGYAILYERNQSGSWEQVFEKSSTGNGYGWSTALSDKYASVGATDDGASGAAYVYELEVLTDIEDPHDPANSFALNVPYPNPFYEEATVGFQIPTSGKIKLAIYNSAGQMVRVVKEEFVQSGPHTIQINASGLAKGLYFLTLETPSGVRAREAFVKE